MALGNILVWFEIVGLRDGSLGLAVATTPRPFARCRPLRHPLKSGFAEALTL
jgi:hypothetical protein